MRLKSQEITLHWQVAGTTPVPHSSAGYSGTCSTAVASGPAAQGKWQPSTRPASWQSVTRPADGEPALLPRPPPPQTTVPRHSTSSRSTTSSLGCRLVGNIVTYIAGFVVKKALDSVSCSTCQEALVSDIQPDDMTQLYHLFIISAR
ncbi:uncharacterized protein LOC122375451 [Amphibalanus amphitrite]|uniref:uncharacterized protein LOC122375451 n=1 Tax=Amphibalanus amphitrite TaxID=1232801 RepID=UPI001C9102F2|nr:uncharacterized protein LOC122375451 [Amphibalanus amphitrite]XP_043210782.1 uncharacterized protein LOC122375451 [Amphibalanus amphitrite]XP_043210783.1 uncharacterized protein LOC122375451 [Amphibalanus amphitrite]XP_043210784.1 uncharacterized protein LOC122375451 [Amphibalanus amphitrite]XP_043210785.1 uncharacterized protein LOC122375451 [Amphibalanus amphitrite]XP_043210786.1 uncharacterized protein LOC122375451 [Amphibalanus amphitrite]